ncbi:tRNA (N6-threonylcarbamoyladenosine(37)-N6)-methyltransferase TrmO [Marinimicrobium sp. ABcell2]|uniref:tRNA (N6-threonylcarbamoyladenosine(37)-N6)-methyltransferase TrmO n=1 Tax=Marinimicrobium sp. ABcell2 TaxID=3069751 RepID=UPI0027B6AA6B|nr:tRNA (N6-threonylcarbamoyladenosine(37)-N6)-methyltransferase TrmO [Marinimicrobium sp. ABcell2]MDQ2076601.1 tRNA (N6-threonylcarbamoyladenosine(37)-N6)-methyltransferase TrmO [Marinimicrobium sp. ABcell2]
MSFEFHIIGYIRSCFTDKFGVPRQPGLVPAARAQLELIPPYDDPQTLVGLEDCSHIWVQFVFHRPPGKQWKARVRPPRLGGNKSLGVFATRSPLRPNPIGLSAVKLEGIGREPGKLWLELSGIDLLDGTPVLDIKPYVPYTDALAEARNGIAEQPPTTWPVGFTPEALAACARFRDRNENLETLIRQILQQDPRPQYQAPDPERRYGMELLGLDVRWRYQASGTSHKLVVEEVSARASPGR